MTATQTDLLARPYEIAEETFLVPFQQFAPPVGFFCLNSLVIRGSEPMLVDTGVPVNADAWLESVFSLVDPSDVRWIFVSHDDVDHTGNLEAALDLCPNATVLTNWFTVGRMAADRQLPLGRCRFVNEGEQFQVSDRTFEILRPPIYDSPTTRAIFDSRTGVLWSSDAFASPVAGPMEWIDDLDRDTFVEGQLFGGRILAPWHNLLDAQKFQRHVDRVQSLPIEVIASCHAPTIRGPRVAQAFDVMRSLPDTAAWEPFTQADLESWLAAMGTSAL